MPASIPTASRYGQSPPRAPAHAPMGPSHAVGPWVPSWGSLQGTQVTLSFACLLLYIFIIISFKLNIGTIVMGTAAAGLIFVSQPRLPLPVLAFCLYVLWCGIGAPQALDPTVTTSMVIDDLKLAVIMIVLVNAVRSRGQLQWLLVTHVSSFFVFAVMFSLYFYNTGNRQMGRAVGYFTYQNSNDLAALAILCAAVCLGIAGAAGKQKLVRLVAFGMAIVTLVLITLTQSRGAMLGLAVGFVVPALAYAKRSRKGLVFLPLALILLVRFAPAGVWNRLAGLTKFDSSSDNRQLDPEGSAGERWKILQTAVKISADNPLFGVGRGNYRQANAKYEPTVGRRDTHNTYLNVLAETGSVGLLLYLAMLTSACATAVQAIRRLRKSGADPARRQLLEWMTAGFVAFLVTAIFGTYSGLAFPQIYFAMLWTAGAMESDGATAIPNGAGRAAAKRGRLKRSLVRAPSYPARATAQH